MKVSVNENCIGCGLCASLCPEVFVLTEDGVARAVDEPVSEECLGLAEEAAESCPVDAIEEE